MDSLVFVRIYLSINRWLPGVVTQKTGPVTYKVTLTNGQEKRCHLDQPGSHTVDVSDPEPEWTLDAVISSLPNISPEMPAKAPSVSERVTKETQPHAHVSNPFPD